jgi:hypothetical protein
MPIQQPLVPEHVNVKEPVPKEPVPEEHIPEEPVPISYTYMMYYKHLMNYINAYYPDFAKQIPYGIMTTTTSYNSNIHEPLENNITYSDKLILLDRFQYDLFNTHCKIIRKYKFIKIKTNKDKDSNNNKILEFYKCKHRC